ncbi:PREDICTED: platelet endothelial aggregation receptor 1-like isoform X2 [Branchiostoma belcheri]|uniref:Platelet endothelial aggregation receptor 1-like isoform X2 n=1 Tax=Branchiostoma belcheri TaxID=7741 RepID=A0A6P4ZK06_BRABE|nr:PREDICTED: platelet endothelial aggregation receptor 1-like isoform X2 [Branchiostoma belcheri]
MLAVTRTVFSVFTKTGSQKTIARMDNRAVFFLLHILSVLPFSLAQVPGQHTPELATRGPNLCEYVNPVSNATEYRCCDEWQQYGHFCIVGACDASVASLCHAVGQVCVTTNQCGCMHGWSPRVQCPCREGRFGPNCLYECLCEHGKCSPSDGQCTCNAGWKGLLCDIPLCPLGYYGPDCKIRCPGNCKSCNAVTGSCQSCYAGFYGNNCLRQCGNCETCNKETGVCEETCQDGWMGENCDKKCARGTYGRNCKMICPENCPYTCNRVSGKCRQCVPGFFGQACENRCPKGCKTCSIQQGVCLDCKPGFELYQGSCEECPAGTYDKDCSQRCPENCKGKRCNRFTGGCNACQKGWRGRFCNETDENVRPALTTPGTRLPCQCRNGGWCDVTKGSCVCLAGYFGKSCENICPVGRYGQLCASRCRGCKFCDHVTGKCDTGPPSERTTVSSNDVTGATPRTKGLPSTEFPSRVTPSPPSDDKPGSSEEKSESPGETTSGPSDETSGNSGETSGNSGETSGSAKTAPDGTAQPRTKDDVNMLMIAVIGVGVAAILALLVAMVICFLHVRRKRKRENESTMEMNARRNHQWERVGVAQPYIVLKLPPPPPEDEYHDTPANSDNDKTHENCTDAMSTTCSDDEDGRGFSDSGTQTLPRMSGGSENTAGGAGQPPAKKKRTKSTSDALDDKTTAGPAFLSRILPQLHRRSNDNQSKAAEDDDYAAEDEGDQVDSNPPKSDTLRPKPAPRKGHLND